MLDSACPRSRVKALLSNLCAVTPLLRDSAAVTHVDIDDTIRATHGYAKQGASYGYTHVKGLNALIATASTPTSAPVIAATRLRKGSTNSARGAGRLIADALSTIRRCGADPRVGALVIVRADSGLLRLRRRGCGPPPRRPVLHHRPDDLHRESRHHRHHRGLVDTDPLPERDLGRGRTAPDLRRRGR